jgi:hypothetical protein
MQPAQLPALNAPAVALIRRSPSDGEPPKPEPDTSRAPARLAAAGAPASRRDPAAPAAPAAVPVVSPIIQHAGDVIASQPETVAGEPSAEPGPSEAELADRVYELIVRRLASERERRGL